MVSFLEILERAQTGPVCKLAEWDSKFVSSRAAEVLREHDFKCDPENPLCSDDGLADDVYEAGFKLAMELGVLCLDTQRIINISEE
jgi:methylamine--corrinoid protein Co-methyltransferase